MHLLSSFALASQLLVADLPAAAPAPDSTGTEVAVQDSLESAVVDSIEAQFTYQRGHVELSNGVASLNVPAGFKFLDADQAQHVVVDLWGNPDADGVIGMVLPEQDGVLADNSYAFVVQYDEMGYVKDDDADDIDYDDLLKDLQEGEKEENEERVRRGFEPAYLVGWAAKPFYDKDRKILHWAKELKFGDSATVNTLNYNVRVLGRKGVLILNAVSSMPQLPLVQQHLPDVLGIVSFNDGYKYEQFDSNVDEVAAWTIGGLVAGKVLVKAGLLAGILKFLAPLWKFIAIGFAALGGWFVKMFRGRKKEDSPTSLPPVPPPDQRS